MCVYLLKTPCGVDTAAHEFRVRRYGIDFASCSGRMLDGAWVPSLTLASFGGYWQLGLFRNMV